jgi:hypothetical protein
MAQCAALIRWRQKSADAADFAPVRNRLRRRVTYSAKYRPAEKREAANTFPRKKFKLSG